MSFDNFGQLCFDRGYFGRGEAELLYQYDEDCAGDGVIALRRFTRLKGFGGSPELFLGYEVKRGGGGG